MHPLIHDWNRTARPPAATASCSTTRRCGTVCNPRPCGARRSTEDRDSSPDRSSRDRHRGHRPAGRRAARRPRRRAAGARDCRSAPAVKANCAARTVIADITPVVEICAADRPCDRVLHFHRIEPAAAVRGRMDARSAASADRRGDRASRCGKGSPSCTSPKTRRARIRTRCAACTRPRSAPGASRVCVADTVGHATPDGAAAVVRFIAGGRRRVRRRRRDRLARPSRSRLRRHQLARGARRGRDAPPWRRDWHRRARRQHADGHAARQSGADGLHRARSVGAASITARRCRARRGVPIPANYPVVGQDAFRTATGVHAAAVIKACARTTTSSSMRSIRASRPAWSDASRKSTSARCRADRTSSSGSRNEGCSRRDDVSTEFSRKRRSRTRSSTSDDSEILAADVGSRAEDRRDRNTRASAA